MPTGVVKFFNAEKGFVFIIPDNGSKDVFSHFSAIQKDGYKILSGGSNCSREVVWSDRKRNFRAEDVREVVTLQGLGQTIESLRSQNRRLRSELNIKKGTIVSLNRKARTLCEELAPFLILRDEAELRGDPLETSADWSFLILRDAAERRGEPSEPSAVESEWWA